MKSVLFLEPRYAHLEIASALKKMGFRVIGCSSSEENLKEIPLPYRVHLKSFDQIEFVEHWNEEDVLAQRLLKKYGQGLAGVHFALDSVFKLANLLRQEMGLPHVSVQKTEEIRSKIQVRRRLQDTGLSELKILSPSEAGSISFSSGESYFFKPNHGCGSCYVDRVDSSEALQSAIQSFEQRKEILPDWIERYIFDRPGDLFFLEEALDGELFSAEGFCWEGQYYPLGLLSRLLLESDTTVEMGSCFPYPQAQEKRILSSIEAVHRALGFDNGFSHVECILTKDGRLEVIDFNPRYVGADVLQSMKFAFDHDMAQELANYAIGLKPRSDFSVKRFSCLQYFLPPPGVETIESIQTPQNSHVPFASVFKSPGTRILSGQNQMDVIGVYLTTGASFEEALEKSKKLRSDVWVNGQAGVF